MYIFILYIFIYIYIYIYIYLYIYIYIFIYFYKYTNIYIYIYISHETCTSSTNQQVRAFSTPHTLNTDSPWTPFNQLILQLVNRFSHQDCNTRILCTKAHIQGLHRSTRSTVYHEVTSPFDLVRRPFIFCALGNPDQLDHHGYMSTAPNS